MTFMANQNKAAGGGRRETDFSNRRFVEYASSDQDLRKMNQALEAAAGFNGPTAEYHSAFGMPFVHYASMEGEPYPWMHHQMQSPLKLEPIDHLPEATEDAIRSARFPLDHSNSRLDVAMADADDEDAVATTSKVVKKGKTRRFAGNGSRNDHPRAKSSIVRHNAKIAKDIAKVKSALVKEETTTVKDEPDTMPKSTEMKSFKIGDTAKVVQFFETTFDFLQQQVDKKVAKAWIKTTCPKKQAKFPYSDKNRWEEFGLGPEIPKWWPEGCDFREPDHLSKPHRVVLCVHLIRLRPDPVKLQEWNKNQTEQNYIHKSVGWTAFLKESTPMSIFDQLQKDKGEDRRERLLDRLYTVAQMEEDYQSGARDGDDLYTYPAELEECEAQVEKTKAKKHSNKRGMVSSDDEVPLVVKPASRKRARRAPARLVDSPTTDESSTLPSRSQSPVQQQRGAESNAIVKRDPNLQMESKPFVHHGAAIQGYPVQRQLDPHNTMAAAPIARYTTGFERYALSVQPDTGLHIDSPLNTSFGSVSSGAENLHSQFGEMAPKALPGYQNVPFGHLATRRNTVQIHCARDITNPEFDIVPNTPTLSPMIDTPINPYGQGRSQPSMFDRMLAHQQMSITQEHARQQQLSQHTVGQHSEHLHPDPLAAPSSMAVPAEYQSFPRAFHPHQSGPPTYYHQYQYQQGFPEHHGPPLVYAEPRVEMEFPVPPPPGDLVRGYTGHSSGVGDGAWV